MASNRQLQSKSAYKIELRKRFEQVSEHDLEGITLRRRPEKYGPLPKKLLRKGVRVDLGCGTGIYTKELSDSGMIIGIDFSLRALEIAKKYCPKGLFILGDLEHLPLKDESIDASFSFTSIYYLPPNAQIKLFGDLYRMLRKNGNIILIEPNAQNVLKERTTFPLDKNKIKKLLQEVGFKRVKIAFCGFMPGFVKKRSRRDPVYLLFVSLESVVERFQIPWMLGSLIIYAEK